MNYVSDCCEIPIKRIYIQFESQDGKMESGDTFFICVCDPHSKVKSETKDGRPSYGCGLPCNPKEAE